MTATFRASSPRARRGLCFDIENKPGTYGPGDYTHPKVTAVGWQFLDEERVHSIAFTRSNPEAMEAACECFRESWETADFVIAHNGRRHDRRILLGLYDTVGLERLSRKRMVDTYMDIEEKPEGYSRSLENLAERWGCPEKKQSMSEYAWEQAYDGVPEFVMLMRRRCESDVRINIWLYHELHRRELL